MNLAHLNLLRLVFWPNILPILENALCVLEKNVYSVAFGWNVLYVNLICSNVSFEAEISHCVGVPISLSSNADVLCIRKEKAVKMNRQTGSD